MKRIILLLSLLATSCGIDPSSFIVQQQPRNTQAAMTATPLPTATIDHAATIAVAQDAAEAARQEAAAAVDAARMAQLTSDAAMRLLVDATVTHEAIQYQYSMMTVTAEQIRAEAARMTATAASTAIPLTTTAQARTYALEAGRMTATAQAPLIAQQIAVAEWQQEYGWSDYVLPWVVVFITVCMLIFIAWYLLRDAKERLDNHIEALIVPSDYEPIPMVRTEAHNVTLRAEIECTKEELITFADGCINHGMTPAFGMWEGRLREGALKSIRDTLTTTHRLRLIPRSGGALIIEPDGEHFLRHVLEHGEPPPPFACTL